MNAGLRGKCDRKNMGVTDLRDVRLGTRVTICRAPTDGVGSQYSARMLMFLWACRRNLVFMNQPMPFVKSHGINQTHAAAIDSYFNLTDENHTVHCDRHCKTCDRDVSMYHQLSANKLHDSCQSFLDSRVICGISKNSIIVKMQVNCTKQYKDCITLNLRS